MYHLSANGVDTKTMAAPLYEGNIASLMVSIPQLSNTSGTDGAGQLVYGYRYDQLNHLVGMNAYRSFDNSNSNFNLKTI